MRNDYQIKYKICNPYLRIIINNAITNLGVRVNAILLKKIEPHIKKKKSFLVDPTISQ